MKRIVPFILALLLLSACGQIATEPETAIETTTEEEITTEIETTTEAPFVATGGESAEITWRTIDITSADGREIQKWLAEQYRELLNERPTEFPMGKDKVIAYKNDGIILRDNKTGKETVLLETTYIGNATTPEEAAADEIAWKGPGFIQALDDRFFAYQWYGWEWAGQTGIYDTKNMRDIPIAFDKKYEGNCWFYFLQICGDELYLIDSEYGPHCGPIHLMRADLKALDKLRPGKPLIAVDVLESIPGVKDVENMGARLVSEDGRYYILSDLAGLRVYDLLQKKLALELPASTFGPDAEIWSCEIVPRDNRVYWVNDDYLAEITLPEG